MKISRRRKLDNLWKVVVQRNGGPWTERPRSKAKVYEYVSTLVDEWVNGVLRSQLVHVYVDEHDGHGMKLYEIVDLQQHADVRESADIGWPT